MTYFRKMTLPALAAAAVLIFTSCGASSAVTATADGSSALSSEAAVSAGDLAVVSSEDFLAAASGMGDVDDRSDKLGFLALAVHSSDGLNYIYIKRDSDLEAKQMIYGTSDDPNPGVSIVTAGTNYDCYEEYGTAENGYDDPFYGYYLRVGGMLIMVTGDIDDSEDVEKGALAFMKKLGYTEL